MNPPYPLLIQGGMGVGVSSWQLARAVSLTGQLGVVSGTGLDAVLARRLQLGDVGGSIREALDTFPVPAVAERIWNRYFRPGGKLPTEPFKSKPMPSMNLMTAFTDLVVVANYVEVFLAKRGHDGLVGVNLMVKIQIPTLPSLFGAMLAGVDVVLMGAGIPRGIPAALDSLAALERTSLPLQVSGAETADHFAAEFDPAGFLKSNKVALRRPDFFPIVSSATLAASLVKRGGGVNGFVVEHHTAGGHNAPPRGELAMDPAGQPIYGPKDEPDFDALTELGYPFWLAGSYGSPEGLAAALAVGATGIQAGTVFAFCEESGILPEIKSRAIENSRSGRTRVYTDPSASPTSYPFKVLEMEETLSESSVYEDRQRICDMGYLRETYRKPNGEVGYRCASEPIEDYVAKGGNPRDADGRKCICNGLLATIGLGQVRKNGYQEPAIVTAGDSVCNLIPGLQPRGDTYTAAEAVNYLLSKRAVPV